jgi:hypothetical protein
MEIIESIFMAAVIIGSVLFWASLIGDMVDQNNKHINAHKKKAINKAPRYTYGEE